MSLIPIQTEFAYNVSKLIQYIFEQGYQVTLGEAWRTPEQAAIYEAKVIGIKNSLHCDRLAIDLNLFKDGNYFGDSKFHQPFGDYWKSLNANNRWGGDFTKPDGNHYERKKI